MAYATGLVPYYTIKNEAFAAAERHHWQLLACLQFCFRKYFIEDFAC